MTEVHQMDQARTDKNIDDGNTFDWGKTSDDYAKYREIYPQEFYRRIVAEGVCVRGQAVLDLGTGTGVLPRNLYPYGASFTGTDIAANQIAKAKELTKEAGMHISYDRVATEDLSYPADTFDVITACQCFFYFRHDVLAPKLYQFLKPGGKLVILYMAWLPFEDEIAGASEDLVLAYHPKWTGCRETRHPNVIPMEYKPYFDCMKEDIYDLSIPFARESWNGRMKACRGIGASLSAQKVKEFEAEHLKLLNKIAPPEFEILHYVAMSILKVKK